MGTALDHPLVAGYLRELDIALIPLPTGAAAELSEQLRAHLLDALPDGGDDDAVRQVLAALGPPALVARAAAEPGPGRAGRGRRRPLLRRAAARAKRVPLRDWAVLAAAAVAAGGLGGPLAYWHSQPGIVYVGSFNWWAPQDAAAHAVVTKAGNVTQVTIPLRPGRIQGFAIFVYNPTDVSQRILGAPADSDSPGAPVPPQIAVSTTGSLRAGGESPHSLEYRAGGTIPPHSYRYLRVLWRSYWCLLAGPGGIAGTDVLALRVKVGWITRTEVVPLDTVYTVVATTKWPAWCGRLPRP